MRHDLAFIRIRRPVDSHSSYYIRPTRPLKVAYALLFPFMMQGDVGTLTGRDHDIWEIVADKLGVRFDYVDGRHNVRLASLVREDWWCIVH